MLQHNEQALSKQAGGLVCVASSTIKPTSSFRTTHTQYIQDMYCAAHRPNSCSSTTGDDNIVPRAREQVDSRPEALRPADTPTRARSSPWVTRLERFKAQTSKVSSKIRSKWLEMWHRWILTHRALWEGISISKSVAYSHFVLTPKETGVLWDYDHKTSAYERPPYSSQSHPLKAKPKAHHEGASVTSLFHTRLRYTSPECQQNTPAHTHVQRYGSSTCGSVLYMNTPTCLHIYALRMHNPKHEARCNIFDSEVSQYHVAVSAM